MPPLVPLAAIAAHRPTMLVNSDWLSSAGRKGYSVVACVLVGVGCVPASQASIPVGASGKFVVVASAALLVQLLPVPPVPASVASSAAPR